MRVKKRCVATRCVRQTMPPGKRAKAVPPDAAPATTAKEPTRGYSWHIHVHDVRTASSAAPAAKKLVFEDVVEGMETAALVDDTSAEDLNDELHDDEAQPPTHPLRWLLPRTPSKGGVFSPPSDVRTGAGARRVVDDKSLAAAADAGRRRRRLVRHLPSHPIPPHPIPSCQAPPPVASWVVGWAHGSVVHVSHTCWKGHPPLGPRSRATHTGPFHSGSD